LSVTGVSTFAAGTVSAPSITTTGDTNTGIFFPAADTIAFAEGGLEAMRIDSGTRLLLGTSVSRSVGAVGQAKFQIEGVDFNSSSQSIVNNQNNDQPAYLTLGKSRGGTIGNNTIVQSGDAIGNIDFAVANGVNINSYGARISVISTATPSSTSVPCAILFSTTPSNATSPLERLRISSAGDVGIGTVTPTGVGSGYRNLVVVGSAGANLDLSDSSGNVRGTISTDNTGGNALFIDTRTNSPIVFRTGASTTERVRIPSAGGLQVVNSISVGNVAPSASGAGITFPATQSASTDANTLDDYEEGTWTPSVGGNATYTDRSGQYTKIGNTVFIQGYVKINTIGTGSSAVISGLPFGSAKGTGEYSISFNKTESLSTSVVSIALRTSGLELYANYRTASSASSTINGSYITSGTEVQFSGSYLVA
jgi:hypothetical protein